MKKLLIKLIFLLPLIVYSGCEEEVDEPFYKDPEVTALAIPLNPAYGENSVLNWEVIPFEGTSVKKASVLVQGIEISSELTGEYDLGPVTEKISIEIVVLMEGKTEPIQRSIVVNPQAQTFLKPTLTVNADPVSLPIGGGVTTLSWLAVNADTVLVNDTPYGPSGSLSVNLLEDSTFIFLAKGPGGQKTASISVAVEPPPPIPTALGEFYKLNHCYSNKYTYFCT